MKLAVFMGGSSAEREVSLKSGAAVVEGLTRAGHDVTGYDVQWETESNLFGVVDAIRRDGTELVFSILHGGLGEDGGIQGVLEAAGLPYTGTGILGSALAMDKHLSKSLFAQAGIPTPAWIMGHPGDLTAEAIGEAVGFPCIVKPVDQGSSVGVELVRDADGVASALARAAQYGERIMAEQFIPGSELSVPILGETPLPVIEIRPSHELYDYECKYTAGMTQYLVPAPIDEALSEELSVLALRVFRLLGLRDIARIDFRLDASGRPFCFEANTLPGMTATSLVPKSAACVGIDFPTLVDRIATLASRRKEDR